MTIVGLISDTHGSLPVQAVAALADADHIVHAGDIGRPAILRELESLAPTTAVLGNNDFDEYGAGVRRYAQPVIDGVRFLVAHYPHEVHIGYNGCAALAPGDPIPQVCVHGHTHVPELVVGREAWPAALLLCPGSPSRPRGGFPASVGRLRIEEGRVVEVRIEALDGSVILQACGAEIAGGSGNEGARP